MSAKYLGLPLDIHGGGSDLVFPHHENEVAQSEAGFGEAFSNYWMHGGMLMINSEKMSKSLGNYLLAKDVVENYDANVVRLLMLQTHYRSTLDYSVERIGEAQVSYERICNAVKNARWAAGNTGESAAVADAAGTGALTQAAADAREAFIAEMDDDFNTAGALGVLFKLVSDLNTYVAAHEGTLDAQGAQALEAAAGTVEELLGVLGVGLPEEKCNEVYPPEVLALASDVAGYDGDDAAAAVDALLQARAAARAEKNWAVADAVRDGLKDLGFVIEDTPAGARVSFQG